jgi:hypothetical protein
MHSAAPLTTPFWATENVRMLSRLSLTVLLVSAWSCGLRAQSTAARVQGTVSDPSGAVIPRATVVASNTETGRKIAATSNGAGQYVLFPLSPGVYTIDFQKEGLHAVRIERLELYASDEVVRNVTLEVGAVSQAVTVSATAAAVLNEAPSVENTVTEDQVNTRRSTGGITTSSSSSPLVPSNTLSPAPTTTWARSLSTAIAATRMDT